MRLSLRRKIEVALLLAILFSVIAGAAQAQDIVGGGVASRRDLSGGAGVSGAAGRTRPKARTAASRTVTRAITAAPTATTGSLSVVAEPGATIYLEPIGSGEALQGRVEEGERIFIFNKLKPGRYIVYAEGGGYNDSIETTVIIMANQNASVTLEPPTFTATFITNINEGSIRYAPVILRGSAYVPTDKTMYMPIARGRVVLTDLKSGPYVADIRADDPGYQEERVSFTIRENSTFDINLKKLESSIALSVGGWYGLKNWDAPSNWRVNSGKLLIEGQGVAVPRNDDYRYYKNFKLVSDVKMINGVAATFVMRYEDAKNYYMIQLTGPNADEPYMLRGFIIRGGVTRSLGSALPISAFASALKTGAFFEVTIEMKDNNIRVEILDSETGESIPLGVLSDPNNTFRVGAIGVAARDNEQNEIGRFIIQAL